MTSVAVDSNASTGAIGTITNGGEYSAAALAGSGGGILNLAGTLAMAGCTVSRNSAPFAYDFEERLYTGGMGGGLANLGTATLVNCTFAYNKAIDGQAIANIGGRLDVNYSTIGEQYKFYHPESRVLEQELYNVGLVWSNRAVTGRNNIACPDYWSRQELLSLAWWTAIYDPGFIQDPWTLESVFPVLPWTREAMPYLAPLGYYGGPTETMPPSVAFPIDDATDGPDRPAFDQRGFPRTGAPDRGAVEYRPGLVVDDLSDEPNLEGEDFRGALRAGPTPPGRLSLRQALQMLELSDYWVNETSAGYFMGPTNNWAIRVARDPREAIRFDPALFDGPRTCTLTRPLLRVQNDLVNIAYVELGLSRFPRDYGELGLSAIGQRITILGPGADLLTIDARVGWEGPGDPVGDTPPLSAAAGIFLHFAAVSDVTLMGPVNVGFAPEDVEIAHYLPEWGMISLERVVIRDSPTYGLFVGKKYSASLVDCVVTGNAGRGVINLGALTMTDCVVSDNAGGGLYTGRTVEPDGVRGSLTNKAVLDRCTIRDNRTAGDGGGILVQGHTERTGWVGTRPPELIVPVAFELYDSLVVGNSAGGNGGGIAVANGRANVTGSTIVGNSAVGEGAGIYTGPHDPGGYLGRLAKGYYQDGSFPENLGLQPGGPVDLSRSTVAGNVGRSAVYIGPEVQPFYTPEFPPDWRVILPPARWWSMVGTIVAGGPFVRLGGLEGGGNLVEGGGDGLADTRTGDPLLAPLGDYGGPTLTMPPLPGSPAIDASPAAATAPAPLTTPGTISGAASWDIYGALTPGRTYSYRVSAYDHRGESAASQAITVTLPARLPRPISGQPGPGFLPSAVILDWDVVPGALGYRIYRGEPVAERLIATVALPDVQVNLEYYTTSDRRNERLFTDYGDPASDVAPFEAYTVTAEATDPRGRPRLVGAATDIGAVESAGFTLTPAPGGTPQSARAGEPFANPLAVTVSANDPAEPVNGGVVSFRAPASGPSASLSAATARIVGGRASVSASANMLEGTYSVAASAAGSPGATFALRNGAIAVLQTSVSWGTMGTAALSTAGDGIRLLPSDRSNTVPWLGINRVVVTLSGAATLNPGDVPVTGLTVANYGPVTLSGGPTTWTITLATPIHAADRVTVTIGNSSITSYVRRLDVLPGDVNDDGVVNSTDAAITRAAALGSPVPVALAFLDVNGDGVITIDDFNLVRGRSGQRLP